MNILYRHPADGFALLWPLVDLGRDPTAAAAYGGVGSQAIAKGQLPIWAVRLAGEQRWRLPVQERRAALSCVADLAAKGALEVSLYQGARARADGRILWAKTDHFSTKPSDEILAPTGVILKAELDPFRPGDFKGLTRRAANDLAAADAEAGLPAVNRFVERVSDVTRTNSDEELKRAAADLRSEQRGLDKKWMEAADPHFKSMVRGTRASVKDRFIGGVEIDISRPQVEAVERMVAQQGWFVRGMDGQRNDALTARARKIVAAGFAQGLGRAEIAADMRKQLPDMWQGMGKGYAHTVAANGLARARSHAELSTYAEGGIQYAEVTAMLDERTTDICLIGSTKVLTERGEVPIERIQPGDRVVTAFGFYSPVLRRSKRFVDSIVRVRISSGRTMYVTEEHPILTRNGWILAGALSVGDVVSSRHRLIRTPREIAEVEAEFKRRVSTLPDPWAELPPRAYAERCSNVLVTEVDVLMSGAYDVYNIEVKDDPTYVAETVVVHNCRLMDGQVIPIQGALDLANKAAAVKNPDDIGKVAPFLRQKRNDKGVMEIHAGKKLLGSFEREGSGTVDDRGRAQQFVAGDDFIAHNVGAPPYHFNCRTTLVPRMDVAQVPSGSAMRAVGPAPFENGDWSSFGAIEQFKIPTPSNPVITGSLTALDDYALPKWKAPDAATNRAMIGSPEAVGVRSMRSEPATRGFDDGAQWSRSNLSEIATSPSLFTTAHDAVLHIIPQANSRATLGALVANPASAGRQRLVQMVDNKGETIWARFNGKMTKAMEDAAMAVRAAVTPDEVKKASEELLRIAEQAGAVKIGKTVGEVSKPATARVTMWTSGLPARSPAAPPRTTGEQPQAGTKPASGPSPIKEEPSKPLASNRVELKNSPVGPSIYSARPDGAAISKATWKDVYVTWSGTSVDANGVPAKRSAWISETPADRSFTTALRGIRPKPTDHVVNVMSTTTLNPNQPGTRRLLVSALEAEIAAGFTGKRDWVVNDHHGTALFLRIDAAELAKLPKDSFGRAANQWVKTGNPKGLKKLGVEMFTDVREAYPKAQIDWNQRNLIAGVPVAEQVDKRVSVVRDEIQTRIRKEEVKLGRALKTEEKGLIIQKIVKEGKSAVKPSEVFLDRVAGMTPKEVQSQVDIDRSRANKPVKLELQTGANAKKAVDMAFQYCSDAVLQALSAVGAPRMYRSFGWNRGFAMRGTYPLGETGTGFFISMPHDYAEVLSGNSIHAEAVRHTLVHEGGHVIESAGKTSVAARVIRNRLIRDVESLTENDISLYGRGGDKDEVALPGKFVDRYDGRVYEDEKALLLSKIGKPLKAKDYQGADAVNEYDVSTQTEFVSMVVERFNRAASIGKNWEIAADQVAFAISALRGHYVPH